ncbi:MAG: type 1 glutamine amidotransferase [Alkalispirochaetaceae bacterium]
MKLILISTRVTEERGYSEKRSSLAYEYIDLLNGMGYLPIPVAANAGDAVGRYLDLEPAAVLLTGGNTVDPHRFLLAQGGTEEADRLAGELTSIYPERDRTEYALIAGALERGLPVLGICRGMQIINCYFGGRVSYNWQGHVGREHQLVSERRELRGEVTNSFHNDVITGADLAEQLRALAHTADGIIEAFYHPEEPVLGFQWHPERQEKEFDRSIIADFLNGDLSL